MKFLGPGMPLDDSARFETGPNDFHRFEVGELVEVNNAPWPWIVTRINTVVGTVDLTPLPSWQAFQQGKAHRRRFDVPDEYGRVGVKPILHN
jgi:hypothetical protein